MFGPGEARARACDGGGRCAWPGPGPKREHGTRLRVPGLGAGFRVSKGEGGQEETLVGVVW